MHSQPDGSLRRLQIRGSMAAESIQSKDWLVPQSVSAPASRLHESSWRKTGARSTLFAAQRCLLNFLRSRDPPGWTLFQLLGTMLIGSLRPMCIQSGEPRSIRRAILVFSCLPFLLVSFRYQCCVVSGVKSWIVNFVDSCTVLCTLHIMTRGLDSAT